MEFPLRGLLSRLLARLAGAETLAHWRALGARIGQDVFIGADVLIDEAFAPLLTIGDGAVISSRSVIMMHDSALNNVCGLPVKMGRVTIGEEAYIGVSSTILCGVTIGRRAIVGAGSLVTKDIPDEAVAYGCPAVVRATVDELQAKHQQALAHPGRFRYWDIVPWRERKRRMKRKEIEASCFEVMRRFHDAVALKECLEK
ncbi:MAG TPA: acyltransferase [Anaerolineae bacterium]|nr:acyltransferase [Anaerolineae bacterium]HOQ98470.1 acyltransferase [Anaerolineae bacterium]HPL29635.1 acyltransferase [Anaerolineae bacterium]